MYNGFSKGDVFTWKKYTVGALRVRRINIAKVSLSSVCIETGRYQAFKSGIDAQTTLLSRDSYMLSTGKFIIKTYIIQFFSPLGMRCARAHNVNANFV